MRNFATQPIAVTGDTHLPRLTYAENRHEQRCTKVPNSHIVSLSLKSSQPDGQTPTLRYHLFRAEECTR